MRSIGVGRDCPRGLLSAPRRGVHKLALAGSAQACVRARAPQSASCCLYTPRPPLYHCSPTPMSSSPSWPLPSLMASSPRRVWTRLRTASGQACQTSAAHGSWAGCATGQAAGLRPAHPMPTMKANTLAPTGTTTPVPAPRLPLSATADRPLSGPCRPRSGLPGWRTGWRATSCRAAIEDGRLHCRWGATACTTAMRTSPRARVIPLPYSACQVGPRPHHHGMLSDWCSARWPLLIPRHKALSKCAWQALWRKVCAACSLPSAHPLQQHQLRPRSPPVSLPRSV